MWCCPSHWYRVRIVPTTSDRTRCELTILLVDGRCVMNIIAPRGTEYSSWWAIWTGRRSHILVYPSIEYLGSSCKTRQGGEREEKLYPRGAILTCVVLHH